ncbi:MAG: TrmH family RNA methyltransferase [Bacilli bacterium]
MIESLNNEKIKYYTKLNDKKYRKSEKLFIAAGEHLVTEALKKNIVKEILLLNGEENVYGDVTYVTSDILKKVSDLTNYPKVLAICYIKDDLKIEGNVVALDNIKDPGNLGTIIRSAVAFNYDTILLSEECVDVYNSKVVRATEGMLFNVNIVTCDLFSTLLKLKESGYKIYGTDVINGESPAYESNKHVLVIGSEARGMSNSIREICDKNLYIKMNDKCESLNAGVSASILMYELGETR